MEMVEKSIQAIIQSDHKGCNLNKYAKINKHKKKIYDQAHNLSSGFVNSREG